MVATARQNRLMAGGRAMTTGQLAKAAHVSPTYLVDIEAGRRDPPSPTVVVAIAAALRMPAVTLLTASIRQRGWVELQVPYESISTAALLAEAWPRMDDEARSCLRELLRSVRREDA